jgi:hypothetical protein
MPQSGSISARQWIRGILDSFITGREAIIVGVREAFQESVAIGHGKVGLL